MAKEYIDREAFKLEYLCCGYLPEMSEEKFDEFPAADVAEVVHGRWEDNIDEWFETDIYTCSKCRESYLLVEGTPKENLWHYCPNCGAKMDGERKEGAKNE